MRIRSTFLISLALVLSALTTNAQSQYKVTLLRAAPGELLGLIDEVKLKIKTYTEQNGDKPYVVRHSQGDQWDLMIYEHIGTQEEYFSQNQKLTKIFTPSFGDSFYNMVSFHESIYVSGADYAMVSKMFEDNGYFHVEMFNALAGKQNELFKQREMENIYLNEIGRDPNLIFNIIEGANWDCFTLGGYRDIKHFAESADIPEEAEQKAALKAGFKGVTDISPYLRSLISRHQDTLGGKL